jgi:hypothetical protein
MIRFTISSLTLVCILSLLIRPAAADLVYDILPQMLTNETTNLPESILGGTIVLVDSATDDGVLSTAEIIEATVHNTMSGTVYANDSFDFSQINVTFSGNQLNGYLRVQHTNTGEAFIDWGGGDLISISNSTRTQFAQADWNPPRTIAIRGVPEPNSGLLIAGWTVAGLFIGFRRRLA